MAKRAKTQARRSGSRGTPGWLWLGVGLLGGVVLAVAIYLGRGGDVDQLLPRPNPGAQAPAAGEPPVAQDAPEPKKPKYEFYDVLRDKEVVIPDAELTAQAQAEAAQPPEAALPPAAESVRYLIQAGAFRSAADAEALKARIALTGEIARVEAGESNGGPIYRVRLGPYPTAGSLAAAKQALVGNGFEAQAIRAQ